MVSKKKSLKIIKKHPGKAVLEELCATTVQTEELNDPYKKKVFSPPPSAWLQSPLLGTGPPSPSSSLLFSFCRLHPHSSHFIALPDEESSIALRLLKASAFFFGISQAKLSWRALGHGRSRDVKAELSQAG